MTQAVSADRALTPEGFDEALRAQLRSEIKVYPARSFWPSSLSHPCDRALVWNFLNWEKKAPHDEVLQSIFDEGREHMPSIYRRLEAMGFEIVRESDRPVQYRVGGGIISGRPDGRIIGFRGVRYPAPRILEIKTAVDHQWESLNTVDDIRNSESHYVRGYYGQGQLYAFLENVSSGVFVLKNKTTGLLKLIPYELDYEHAEGLLKRVERLQPMVDEGKDPDPIVFNWKVCGSCGFLDQCYPAKNFGEGASVIDDAAFVAQLERREQLRPQSSEYDAVDREIKARLKHEGIKEAIAGPFVIQGAERNRKAYSVEASSFVQYTIKRAGAKPVIGEA